MATAEVIPTSTMEIPAQEEVVPTEDLINDALRHRAELVETRIDLNSRDYSNKAVRSALLPTLDLFAYYGGSGLGGSQNPSNLCANQTRGTIAAGLLRRSNPEPVATLIPLFRFHKHRMEPQSTCEFDCPGQRRGTFAQYSDP